MKDEDDPAPPTEPAIVHSNRFGWWILIVIAVVLAAVFVLPYVGALILLLLWMSGLGGSNK